jgi:predicted Rossmann-fold nucleotide-binding protein
MYKRIKWVSIGGSSKGINKRIAKDVKNVTREVIKNGCGIVSGGDFGVDHISINEALKHDPRAKRIMIFLPVEIDLYIKHCKNLIEKEIFKKNQGEKLIFCLEKIKKINPASFIENKKNKVITDETISKRDEDIITIADEAISFHINKSLEMAKIIKKIQKKGIPFKVFTYDTKK